MKLLWVTLHVGDLEKSLGFYIDILGMEIAFRFGGEGHRIVMLGKEDESKVELIHESGLPLKSPGDGVSFGLETNDLDGLTAKLEQAGYPVRGPLSPNPKIRFSFVKDPDGYTVQLVEQK